MEVLSFKLTTQFFYKTQKNSDIRSLLNNDPNGLKILVTGRVSAKLKKSGNRKWHSIIVLNFSVITYIFWELYSKFRAHADNLEFSGMPF